MKKINMADNIKVRILTPNEVACNCMSCAVTIPAEMGEMQIHKGHISLVSRLKKGKIIVFKTSQKSEEFEVEEGLFQVNADEVNILADKILNREE